MKGARLLTQASLVLGIIGVFLLPVHAAESSPRQAPPSFSTDAKETQECVKQMTRIYSALQEYYKKNRRLPNLLSDLVPTYVHNPRELICPYVKRSGDQTGWRLDVDQAPFNDPGSCYAYEFTTNHPHYLAELTMAEVKSQHMKLFGFGLPVLRCFAHRPRLNVAYDGTLYQSNMEWEDAFLSCRDQMSQFHRTLSDTNALSTTVLAAVRRRRPAYEDLTPHQLDLSTNYNAPLFHLCRLDRRGQLLTTHPMPVETIGGVLFDIRALIHLGGDSFPIPFPLEVQGIRVDAKCDQLHFLHGLVRSPYASALAPGSTNAIYSIQFADGSMEEFPIIYGKSVNSLWLDPDEAPVSGAPPAAWSCPIPGTPTALRLYVKTWRNPRPDKVVERIGIRSLSTNCAPFLVAITREDRAPVARTEPNH